MDIENFFNLTEEQWKHKVKTEEIDIETLTCLASHIPDKIWNYLAIYQKLTAQFILDFYFKFNIPVLLTNQVIHQKTIQDNLWLFQDHMWHICRYQYLSEDFIIDHKDIVNWRQIFLHQKHLKPSFISKNFKYFPRHEYIYEPTDVFNQEIYFTNINLIKALVFKHNKRIKKLNSIITSRS